MSMKYQIIIPGSLATIAIFSGAILASNNIYADDVVDEVNITVPVSCSLSGAGMNTHNAEITNGTVNSAIGETTLKAYCNDNNGFAIYAIGYTDNTDGKNVLTSSTLGSTYDIATGTATSGDTSNWAMKLSTITDPAPTYPITIAGSSADTDREQGDPDYSTFQAVPDDYTLVAKRTSNTDIGASAEGTTLKTTYQAYISKTQPAGTYTGQVKYTLVHPNDATAPVKSVTIATAEYLQEVNSCPAELPEEQVYTLKDSRDEQEYKVAKLKDGRCWFLDNLALDPTNASTAANMSVGNTNAPAAAIYNYLNGGNPDNNEGWSSDAVINTDTISSSSEKKPELTNKYKNLLVTSFGPASTNGQAKAGVYYSYCAATVGTYCSSNRIDIPDTLIDAPYDICPSNWRMPTGGPQGEYTTLAQNYNSTAADPGSLQFNLSTPLSGGFVMGSWSTQNNSGAWLSSTVSEADYINYMYDLNVTSTTASTSGTTYRNFGATIRCILK